MDREFLEGNLEEREDSESESLTKDLLLLTGGSLLKGSLLGEQAL